jgi:hypothetical protein
LLVGKKDFHDVRGKGQSVCSSATLAVGVSGPHVRSGAFEFQTEPPPPA